MIRSKKIACFVKAAADDGVDVDAILASVSMSFDDLNEPNSLISYGCAVAVLSALQKYCSPEFPLRNGARSRQLDLGIVGHALLSSPSMSELVDFWVKYSEIVGHPLKFTSRLEGKYWVLEMTPRFPMPEKVLRFVLEDAISSQVPLGRDCVGADFATIRYEMTVSAPPDPGIYSRWLDAPVRFNCSRNRVVMDRRFYTRRVASADQEVLSICEKHCVRILQDISAGAPYASKIKALFLASRGVIPSERDAAAKLGMSVRSLHRRLAEEGYSYQQLLNDYRRDYAFELLKEQTLQVKEIAFVLGYSNASSFRRAFKEWTGMTVTGWLAGQGVAKASA